MTEETQKVETPTEEPKKEESTNPIEIANKILAEIKEENVKREELIARDEKLQAEKMLGGTAGGNVPTQEVTEEQQKKQQAMDFWKGTGIDKAIEAYDAEN